MSSEDGDMGFQIAPMVDVVFVLLLFFMACAGSQVIEKQLSVNLPAEGMPSRHMEEPLFIDIASDGTVSLNNTVYGLPANKSLAELKAFLLEAQKEFGVIDSVLIRPAPDTRQERVIDVLDACAVGKVKKLTFG